MNKMIGLSIILALCTTMSMAQAAPVSSTQLKILDAQSGDSASASVDTGVTSVSPGVTDSSTVLSTQAMTAPTSDDADTAGANDNQAAATFESATAGFSPAADVAGITDFDAAVPSLLDDFPEYDFTDAGGASATGPDRVLVSEPGMLLLWLTGLLALVARRR